MKKQFSNKEPQMTMIRFEMILISLGTRGFGAKTASSLPIRRLSSRTLTANSGKNVGNKP